MSLKALLPSPTEIGREALILLAGAVIAAVILKQMPSLAEYVRAAWNPPPAPPANP